MKCLLIDDERLVRWVCQEQGYDSISAFNDAEWDVAKNYEEAIDCLSENSYDLVTFDHDLGYGKNGYDALEWLERRVMTTAYCPDMKIEVHTANMSAYVKMAKLADRIEKLCKAKRYALNKKNGSI